MMAEMWGKMRDALSRCCRPNQNVCASGRSARNAAQNSKPFALAVAAAFVLIGLALTSDAEAQTLGGTEPFAVLGNETVTNTGPTVLTGDLGVYDGTAITGFFGTVENDGPGIVNGAIHQTDAVAQAAQADANTLFTVLMGLPTTATIPADLAGLVLGGGVYEFKGGAALNTGIPVSYTHLTLPTIYSV